MLMKMEPLKLLTRNNDVLEMAMMTRRDMLDPFVDQVCSCRGIREVCVLNSGIEVTFQQVFVVWLHAESRVHEKLITEIKLVSVL